MRRSANSNKDPIRQAALYWLSRRDYTAYELSQKLQQKGHASAAIEQSLADLIRCGLIDDDRYADNFIHARRNRGYGPKRIALDLRARGLGDEIIAMHLIESDAEWRKAATKVWQKRFKGEKPAQFADRAKQIRYLLSRGFTQRHINHLFESDDLLAE